MGMSPANIYRTIANGLHCLHALMGAHELSTKCGTF